MTKAKRWKLIFYILGVLIFAYMIYAIGIDKIWSNIKETGWWFFPIIGIWLVVYIINSFAWNTIIRDKETPKEQYPSFLKVLKVTVSGYTINYITPVVALGGEPYRILEMKDHLGAQKATSAVLSYSMMHILSHVVFWMCSIVLILILLQPAWGLAVGCIIMFAVFVFALYMLFQGYQKGMVAKTFRILGKVPILKKYIRKFNEDKLQSFQEIDKNIVNLLKNRKPAFISALGLEVLARTVSCFELFFIAKAINIDISLLDSIVLYAGSTLFSNLLFFSPMQLGTREGGLALTLKTMGYTASLGIYMGLVMRIRELFWIGIGLLLMKIKSPSQKHDPESLKVLTEMKISDVADLSPQEEGEI